jgi:UDP-galactose transporter B1
MTTTRKFFTLLLSVVLFGHVLTVLQWQAVAVVFSGLALDTYQGYLKSSSTPAKKQEKTE